MEIGIPELLIILVIVILIFGPGRIMKLGRDLGDGVRQFRNGIQELKDVTEIQDDLETNEENQPEESQLGQSSSTNKQTEGMRK